jgi:peroxiredoxin
MNKKVLLITLIVLLVVLGVAAALYPKLSQGMESQQLAPAPTAATTVPAPPDPAHPEKETEPPQQTEPELVAAPDFTVLDMDGNQVQFSDYAGKPIVLNFWAHWCGPCQMEMPEFNAAWEALEGEVTFLMVHVGADIQSGKEKVAEGGYTFPVVFDKDSQVAAFYGVSAFPTTFFIDKDGYLKAYYMGAMDADLLQQGLDLIYTAE